MSAPFLNGAPAPRDPFQGARTTTATSVLALARQWDDLTRQIDDDAAYRQAELADPPFGGDEWADRLWTERASIETKIRAHAEPTVAGIVAKLRMVAWHLRVAEGGDPNELTDDEQTIASALADAERIAKKGEG
jgi:hypothetical protein